MKVTITIEINSPSLPERRDDPLMELVKQIMKSEELKNDTV